MSNGPAKGQAGGRPPRGGQLSANADRGTGNAMNPMGGGGGGKAAETSVKPAREHRERFNKDGNQFSAGDRNQSNRNNASDGGPASGKPRGGRSSSFRSQP